MEKDKLTAIDETLKQLGALRPKAMGGFKEFMNSVKMEGFLSPKIKTIIGVALAVSRQCEYCVPFYTQQALESGATREEILEACLVAALMGGGPSLTFIKHVLDALEEFAE